VEDHFAGAGNSWGFRFLGYDLKNGKVEIGGTGDGVVSFTSRCDVARYVVHVLVHLPLEQLHNRVVKVEGERTSINQVLVEYRTRTGKQVEVTRITIEEVEAAAKSGDWKAYFQPLQYSRRMGRMGRRRR